jgi:hypothetical protein
VLANSALCTVQHMTCIPALLLTLLPSGACSLTFPVMRELLEELGAPAPVKPSVALAFVAPAGLKEVQAALGSEVRGGGACGACLKVVISISTISPSVSVCLCHFVQFVSLSCAALAFVARAGFKEAQAARALGRD